VLRSGGTVSKKQDTNNLYNYSCKSGLGSSVGIATGYGLEGPGIEFQWGRNFPHLSRPPLGPPSLLYNGYRVFPRGSKRPGRDADLSPLLVSRSENRVEPKRILSLRAFVVFKKSETFVKTLL
jgi:hypothetical protein